MATVAISSVGASLGKLSLSGAVTLHSRATEKGLTSSRPSSCQILRSSISRPTLSKSDYLGTSLATAKHRPSSAVAAAGFFPIVAKQNGLKRQKQNEKRRVYHKARRSEMSTRMKKVLTAIESLRKKPDLGEEDIGPVEKLIADAYSIIDKSAKVGTIHRNKASRRKSRLARAKRTLLMQAGLYTPAPAAAAAAEAGVEPVAA
eukprot:TRINITY_DN1987_c0_g1_i3.p1 TRINITY_DN1987_c0_g1~~TRINITY_DN1987_c0_g1_i3.p1  ORF type:complete len:203 (-),score=29.69 TRINITY_DN1987_c0_g1_i3:259-867(-)